MRIKDSWEKINTSVYDGSHYDKYHVGDTKSLNGIVMKVTEIKRKSLIGPFLKFKSTEPGNDLEITMF